MHTSLPSTSAVSSRLPSTPPICSATASAAGKLEELECIVLRSCVSPKSRPWAMEALAKAAQIAGSFLPKAMTVASPAPPAASVSAMSIISRQPSPSVEAPRVMPMASSTDFFWFSMT